uniref:Uncharacterized protein n=1 Tax=viral metagenome TaxID=1070528 RepID=A0A6C0JW20_9ZZZZ
MKIAVVLTGHMRCWNVVYPNFKERILDKYSPDIFIHTWKDEGYWTPQEIKTKSGVQDNTPMIDVNLIKNLLNPIDFVVEDWNEYNAIFDEYAKQFPNFAHKPKNILSMFYKLNAGISLLEKYINITGTQYDLVIRMRSDMILHDELDLSKFDRNVFYTLAHRNHMGQGTGDQIHIGNVFDSIAFAKISCFIPMLYASIGLLCPHVMSVAWLKNRFNWSEFYINKSLQHTPNGEYVLSDELKDVDNRA